MLEISDLGLTPLQLAEVERTDEILVEAWLQEASRPSVRNPTSLFLWGIKSGQFPDQVAELDDGRVRVVQAAEKWIQNVGLFLDREEELLDELFGRHGKLRHYAEDVELQKRMVSLWARARPGGIEVEHEQRERASRNAATYFALRRRDEGSEAGAEAAEGPDAGSRGGAATADQGGRAGGDGGPL